MFNTRKAWFPLRSNIAFFEAEALPLDLEARVKQMALLSDTLYFEPGLLDVSVADDGRAGISEFWTPPEMLNEEDIRQRRESARKGVPFQLVIAPESAPGVPGDASKAFPLISGPLSRGFVAEFHLLVQESGLEDQPWVEWVWLNDEGQVRASKMQRQADLADFSEKPHYPQVTESSRLDERLRKGLNRDLIWSSLLDAPALVDPLHEPLLETKSRLHAGTTMSSVEGARALHLWAPNFTSLPWKRVIELHDHEAIGAFREKLIEAEELVAPLPEEERDAALQDIGYQALLSKVAELMPNYRGLAAELAAGALVDLVPWGGTLFGATKGLAKVRREQSEWMAVLVSIHRG